MSNVHSFFIAYVMNSITAPCIHCMLTFFSTLFKHIHNQCWRYLLSIEAINSSESFKVWEPEANPLNPSNSYPARRYGCFKYKIKWNSNLFFESQELILIQTTMLLEHPSSYKTKKLTDQGSVSNFRVLWPQNNVFVWWLWREQHNGVSSARQCRGDKNEWSSALYALLIFVVFSSLSVGSWRCPAYLCPSAD